MVQLKKYRGHCFATISNSVYRQRVVADYISPVSISFIAVCRFSDLTPFMLPKVWKQRTERIKRFR